MKKLLLILLVVGCYSQLFAQSNHTVTFSGNASDFNASEKYSAAANGTDYYITYDATTLYIGAFRTSTTFGSTDNFAIYIDTDPNATPTSGTGTTTAQSYNGVSGTLPFSANYDAHLEQGYQEARSFGSSWASTISGYGNWVSTTSREISIPFSIIGNPNSLYITMWMGYAGGFYSNVPGANLGASGTPTITNYFGGFGVSSADCIPVNTTNTPITDVVTNGVPASGALYGKVIVNTGTVTATNNFNIAPGGSIQVTGGTLDISGLTIQMGGTSIGSGLGTTINTSGSGVLTTNGSTSITFNGEGNVTGNNLSESGTVVINKKYTPLASGGLTLNGTLQINAGGFVNTNAITYATNSTLKYNTGTTPYVRGTEWNSATSPGYPYNVQISNNTTVDPGGTVNTGLALNMAGSLTIDAGSSLFMDYSGHNMTVPLTINGALSLTGSLSESGAVGGDINLTGNWTNNGSATNNFNANSRTVTFQGTSAQTLGGTNTLGFGFGFITVNNSGGISLGQAITVANTLTVENGSTLSLNGNNASVASVTISGAGTNTIQNANATAATLTVTNSSSDTYAGVLADGTGGGALSIVENGSAALIITGASNTYTGSTTVTAGTIQLGNTNAISTASSFIFNGGTLSTGTASVYSNSINNIQVTNTSTLALGTTGTHTISLTGTAGSWTALKVLNITGWTGTAGAGGGSTSNGKIIIASGLISSLTPYLGQINFGSPYSQGAIITASNELVPAYPVPSTASSAGVFGTVSPHIINLSWTSGNGSSRIVVIRNGSAVSFTPSPANTYDGANNHVYSSATDLTIAGQRCIYNSTGNSVTITGLTAGVTYYFAIYEYNGTAGSEVYGSAYTPASQATLGTFTATTTGSFTTAGTWFNSDPPSVAEDFPVVINTGVNLTLNTGATVASLTVNSGGTFTATNGSAQTLTISNNTTGTTLSNSGTWANGTGASTVAFSGSATHTISGTIGFNNLTTSSTLNPGTGTTVNGTLTLNSGGSIATNPVAYGSSATLYYNEGGGVGSKINTTVNEWPNTGAAGIYIDNNTWIQIASGKSITGDLFVNSGALQSIGANTLTMNGSGTETITVKNGNGTPGAIYGTDNGFGNDLTLSIASTSITIFTGDAPTNTDDNKKFVAVTVNGTLRLQRGILVEYGAFTVNGTLQIDANGYVQSFNSQNSVAGVAPTYNTNALLKYNSNTTYGRNFEWSSTSGAGYPYHVQLSNSTTLDLGNGAAGTARQCAGNLTIDAGSNMNLATSSMTANLTVTGNVFINGTLTLSTSSGGNIQLGGNWYRNGSTGTFTPNARAVFFIGSNNQYVTVQGGGTETFPYLRDNISTSGKYLKPNNNLPDTTNIVVNGTSGNVLEFLSSGSLDLNGRKVNIDYNNSSTAVSVYVPGNTTVTDSAGIYNGEFKFMSSAHPNQPTWVTTSVINNSGVGSLAFDNNCLVSIADGQIDFGASGGTNITTINGVLQIKLGGSVGQSLNSCIYGTNSTLLFANDIDYQVPSADKTWAAGAVTSGLPGIPYNVSVKDVGTNLTINSPRAVRGDMTINNDTLTLNPSSGNTFSIGGSWSRSGALSCFKNNAVAKVLFNGSVAQTISCTANSNVETFRELEIANTSSGGVVSLGGSTSLVVADSLILTHGVLTTSSNQVVIPDTCIIKAGTGNSNYTVSWINGTMKRFFTNGSTALWLFPVGTATNGCLASIQSHSITFSGGTPPYYFTASFAGPLVKSGNNVDANLTAYETSIGGIYHTAYTSINGAGSWKIEPSSTTFTGNYDVNLYFTGFTGLADNQFGILKRPVTSTTYADFKPYGGTLNATNGAGRTVSGGFALRMGLSSFSEYAVGEAGAVLPITLVSFTGQNDGSLNTLAWTTASELNTDHFSVQRSADANSFTEIGTVKAAGFSVSSLNYTFVDDNPASGINYYRLATVDQNGQISYSEIIAVSSGQITVNTVVVYPNPVLGDISFDVNTSASSLVNYSLTDVLGRVIQTGQLSTSAGINHYQITGSGLSHGVYFLNVSNTQMGLFKTTRLVKAE